MRTQRGENYMLLQELFPVKNRLLQFDQNGDTIGELGVGCAVRRDASGLGKNSAWKVKEVTRLTNERPSKIASTMPAVKEEQLSPPISFGTEMYLSIGGSLSMIISRAVSSRTTTEKGNQHSSEFSTLRSIPSAGRPKTAFQAWFWIMTRTGKSLISRLAVFEDPSARQAISSSTRVPIR